MRSSMMTLFRRADAPVRAALAARRVAPALAPRARVFTTALRPAVAGIASRPFQFNTPSLYSSKAPAFDVHHVGEHPHEEFRVYFGHSTAKMSPWHKIPLFTNEGSVELLNFVNEIPKNSKAKMEIATKEQHNPIKQDIKKGNLRYYHEEIRWNYGCFPQTWEDPAVAHPELKVNGDNDPIDVVEIGQVTLKTGHVEPVKVLGCLSMIDEGELDWKVIAISSSDPLAHKIHDVHDVEAHMPGTISEIREWFRNYKIPDGKPANAYGHDEECLPKAHAMEAVMETNEQWKRLVEKKADAGKLHV